MTDADPAVAPPDRLDAYWFEGADDVGFDRLRETFEWGIPASMNLATYLCDRWADAAGERVAMKAIDEAGEPEEVTYGTLRRRSNRLARHLRARGVERGDRVAVLAVQRPATLVAFLAAWKLGAVVVPVSPKYGEDALAHRIDDAGIAACVAGGSAVPAVRSLLTGERAERCRATVVVDERPTGDERAYGAIVGSGEASFDPVETRADEPALLLYTSGTTGDPKGVVHAHHTVLGMAPSYALSRCNLELEPPQVAWVPAAWSWIASLTYVLPALFYGHAVLGDATERFDPMRTFEQFDAFGVTLAFLPGAAVDALREELGDPATVDQPQLRVAMCGHHDEDRFRWLRAAFENAVVHRSYGQTEACLPIGHCSALFAAPDDAIGRAMPGHEVTVRDPDTGAAVPDGEKGEIAIAYEDNPACLDGYWNREDAMAEKVRDGWLRTSDLGELDAAGNVFFHGRLDDVINCSGYRVGPGEVESVLAAHDAVAEAGVIGIPDDRRGEVPKAFVVLRDGTDRPEALVSELQDLVKAQYAAYAYPREIEFVDELPRVRGKLRRAALREREGIED